MYISHTLIPAPHGASENGRPPGDTIPENSQDSAHNPSTNAGSGGHPGKGPFDDPAAVQDRETFDILGLLDNLQSLPQPHLGKPSLQFRALVATIRPQLLDRRGLVHQLFDHIRRPIAVLNRGLV